MKKQIYFTMLAACLCVLTNAQTVIPSYVPTNGLVGWWPFNGNAIDESINTNDGTVNGATLTADRFGSANSAYSFNGVNNRIDLPLNLSGSLINATEYSFSGFIKDFTNGTGGLFSNWKATAGNPCGILIGLSGNKLGGGTDGGQSVVTTNTISNTNWVHVAVIFNGNLIGDLNRMKLYINGTQVPGISATGTSNIVSGNLGNTSTNTAFGAWMSQFGWTGYFSGKLDDIGIWNRALTECEVKKLYTSGSFSVSSSVSNTICVGQSLNLSAAGANSYTWSTGATSQSISVSPTVSTVYTVSTTYSAGCTDSRTFNVTVNVCTGLNETEFATNSVCIFPNPAKEQLNISLNNIALIGKNYTITNALGQVMATGVFNKQTMELTIQQFSSGLYQLNIDGLQENYKFIKE
jgi:hypothetical protein